MHGKMPRVNCIFAAFDDIFMAKCYKSKQKTATWSSASSEKKMAQVWLDFWSASAAICKECKTSCPMEQIGLASLEFR